MGRDKIDVRRGAEREVAGSRVIGVEGGARDRKRTSEISRRREDAVEVSWATSCKAREVVSERSGKSRRRSRESGKAEVSRGKGEGGRERVAREFKGSREARGGR